MRLREPDRSTLALASSVHSWEIPGIDFRAAFSCKEDIELSIKDAKSTLPMALALLLLLSVPVGAQTGVAALSGVITGPAGTVENAVVSVKNLATGQTADARSDVAGQYHLPNLLPGDYEISVSATGLAPQTVKTTLVGGAAATVNLALTSPTTRQPSLGDLGFTPGQAQGSAADQARLDRRSHVLKIHQRLGLITAAPFIATFIASNGAAGRNSSASGRNLHMGLGILTEGMYWATASYAIRAPRISGTKTRGPIAVHKALAWVHGTGMILTPIMGALAYHQRSNGQKVTGFASAHGAVATVTGIAYGAALLSVTLKF